MTKNKMFMSRAEFGFASVILENNSPCYYDGYSGENYLFINIFG